MKKTAKIVSIMLVVIMAVMTLVSCSKYPSLKSAFEKKGYKENTQLEDVSEKIKKELEENNLVVTLHLLTKESNGITSVLIVEFQSTDKMQEAYKDSNTIQGLIKDIKSNDDANAFYDALVEAGYACGNCLAIPLSLLYVNEITTIVKSVK